jgi:hypothetical protein
MPTQGIEISSSINRISRRRYFTNDVQFKSVMNFCGSRGAVATTAMNRWPSAETVNPRGIPAAPLTLAPHAS